MYRACVNFKSVSVEINATAFMPEWHRYYTIQQMESDLAPFKFEGPGWYITQGKNSEGEYKECLLVIPSYVGNHENSTMLDQNQIFLVCGWNHHEAADAFNWIVNAPTRVDERFSKTIKMEGLEIELLAPDFKNGRLVKGFPRDSNKKYVAVDALEATILGHACAGVDVQDPKYIEGIRTALDAIGNNL